MRAPGADACGAEQRQEPQPDDACDESPPLLRHAPDGDDAVLERRAPYDADDGASGRGLTSCDADGAEHERWLLPLFYFLLERSL